MSKVWEPVEDGAITSFVRIENNGAWIRVYPLSGFSDYPETARLPSDLRLCRLVDAPEPVALDMPDGPGWWSFEGSAWTQKRVGCSKEDADGWRDGDWDEHDEPSGNYFRYEDVLGEPFRSVLNLEWVVAGQAISDRNHCGPHRGEPVLGFLSPTVRWDHVHHGIDTIVGKWYRLTMPWEANNE